MQLSIFRYIFKIPDLRKRIFFTLFMFAVYRLGAAVPVPGVDLEESDGAQDIGNDSFFPFYDPSSGYFGDMWFFENPEYFRANPQNEGSLPSFTKDTYPNTNANNGSKSYLSFENIIAASRSNLLRGCMVISEDKSSFKHRLIKSGFSFLISLNSGKYLPG